VRTSGHSNSDIFMNAVPIGILLVFGLIMGGGVTNTLHTMEVYLAQFAQWLSALVS
jgi:hypothetical protein